MTRRTREVAALSVPRVQCHLCDSWLREKGEISMMRGLATLDIDYPGPARMICDNCIRKVKQA